MKNMKANTTTPEIEAPITAFTIRAARKEIRTIP